MGHARRTLGLRYLEYSTGLLAVWMELGFPLHSELDWLLAYAADMHSAASHIFKEPLHPWPRISLGMLPDHCRLMYDPVWHLGMPGQLPAFEQQ